MLNSPVPVMVAQVAAGHWPPAAPPVFQNGTGGPEVGEAIAASGLSQNASVLYGLSLFEQ